MKRGIYILVMMVINFYVVNTMNAQGFYGGIGGGYGFAAEKKMIAQDIKVNSSGVANEFTNYSTSFGKGMQPKVYVGYKLTKSIGVELGVSYLKGNKVDAAIHFYDSANTNVANEEITMNASMYRVIPTLRITEGEKKIHLVLKTGLIIGIKTRVIKEDSYEGSYWIGLAPFYDKTEYKNGMSWGWYGALELNYDLTERLAAFADVDGYFQNWSPKKSEITKYTYNGQDKLNTLTVYDRETEYVDHYTQNFNSATGIPRQDGKFYYPFSSIGVCVGIHFLLTTKSPK